MIDPREFYEELVREGAGLFTGVPDSLLKDFCACITDQAPKERSIIAANEGNAVGIACGYHLSTGGFGVVYLQNSGEGNIVNPLLSIADPEVYAIPVLLVIGWRGEPGVHDEPQHVKQGRVTRALLETMEIPHVVLDERTWREDLSSLVGFMKEQNHPVAVVVRKGTFSAYPFTPEESGDPLSREEALEAVLGCLEPDDFVVSTTGKTSREVFELREAYGQGHANDFLTVGGMGHTSSIAFGMALGTDRNVWCIDGDGSFLMHMGAFAVIGQNAPDNFKYILNNNGAHESVGGQPTVGRAIDITGVLRACGFDVVEASTVDEIVWGMEFLRGRGRAALILNTHQGSRADLGRPTTTPRQNKQDLMERLKGWA